MDQGAYSRVFFARKGLLAVKWAQYLPVYDRKIDRFLTAGLPVRLLEIGIAKGGSLAIWEELLPPGSTIIGLDIEPACADLVHGPSVRELILDAADAEAVQAVLGDTSFDIIIDDGSHRSNHIIAHFGIWFPRLSPGGIYIIEDLHVAYWPDWGGGYLHPASAISFLKMLIDTLLRIISRGAPAFQKLSRPHLRRIARRSSGLSSMIRSPCWHASRRQRPSLMRVSRVAKEARCRPPRNRYEMALTLPT